MHDECGFGWRLSLWCAIVPRFAGVTAEPSYLRAIRSTARWEYKKQQPFSGKKSLLVPAETLCSSLQILTTAWESAGESGGGPLLYLCSGPKKLLAGLCVVTGTNCNFASVFFLRGAVMQVASCLGDHVWVP